MDAIDFAAKIRERFGADTVESISETVDPFIVVPANKIAEICRFLRDDRDAYLDGLSNLSGVDWPEDQRIEVVYHLWSYRHHHMCVLKTSLPREHPELDTVEGVWKTANWFEREAYDLLGIRFTGHPNLKRLLMPDDWEGYPLRKDYEEKSSYHGVETTREDPLKAMGPAPWGAPPPAPPKPTPQPKPRPAPEAQSDMKDGEGGGA